MAAGLNRVGLGTLLVDLLTPDEELSRASVFNVALLAARLTAITRWLRDQPGTAAVPVGYVVADTGTAAALAAARTWWAVGWAWSGYPPCSSWTPPTRWSSTSISGPGRS